MNPPSKDICDMLEAAGLGLTFQTNLFVGKEPDKPDTCVTIFDTPGGPPDHLLEHDDGYGYYYPTVSIRVRASGYLAGYSLIENIKIELHGIGPEAWNGTTYTMIKCMQDQFLLDYDEKNRPRFVCNFDIQRKP